MRKSSRRKNNTDAPNVFGAAYEHWKENVRAVKTKLQGQLEEEELAEIIENVRALEKNVTESFGQLMQTQVPDQVTRQRMDSCSANTNNLVALAQTRMAEVGMQQWDDEAEQARLQNMLYVDCARSLYSVRTSSSVTSNLSHSSSVSEKRATAAAELAAKEAELRASRAQQQERLRLQAELDRLDTEKAIAIKKAEVAALDKELGRDDQVQESSQTIVLNPNVTARVPPTKTLSEHNALNPNATAYVPPSETLLAIKEIMNYSCLPTCEPPVFGGDPLEFPRWKRSFEILIGHRQIRPSNKLALLEKYLKNEAAESINGMFYRSDEYAYDDAWTVLNERFGHPSLILSAFRSRLSTWPKINPKDYLGIQKLSDYLTALDHAMPHINGLTVLNDQEENKKNTA